MSHVYYFGSESFKPKGTVEMSIKDLSITRVALSYEDEGLDKNSTQAVGSSPTSNKVKKIKFVSVTSGRETVFVIDDRSEVWTFGSGSKGQLGLDESIHKLIKATNINRHVGFKEKIKSISACSNHVLALTETNKIYGWGDSNMGKLSEIDLKGCLRPHLINSKLFQLPEEEASTMIQEKTNRIAAQTTKNSMSASTSNLLTKRQPNTMTKREESSVNLKFDLKSKTNRSNLASPTITGAQVESNQRIKTQDFRQSHTEGLPRISGKDPKEVQLQVQMPIPTLKEDTPSSGFLPALSKVMSSSTMNNNNSKQIGTGEVQFIGRQSIIAMSNMAQKVVPQIPNINALIGVGFNQSFVGMNGLVFSFGKNENGILGIEDDENFEYTRTPLLIREISISIKITGIAAGQFHNLAWDDHGAIYSWGDGSQGQLGHPIDEGYSFTQIQTKPKRIQLLKGKNIIQASCGKFYSSAITIEGELFAWGRGEAPKEGSAQASTFPSLMESLYPKKLMPEGSNTIHVKFIKVSCGANHNATIDQFGRLYTWGDSTENCLGHSEKEAQQNPKLVSILKSKVTLDVACGDRFTVVIQDEDGRGKKPSIVDQFKARNISNIRQKIKSIYDYSKLRAQIQNDTDDKSVENNKSNHNIKLTEDPVLVDQKILINGDEEVEEGDDVSLSLSNIGMDSPPPKKSLGKLRGQYSTKMSTLPDSKHTQSVPSLTQKKFELNLEGLAEKQKLQETLLPPEELDSKDSAIDAFKTINNILEGKFKDPKTLKALQDSSLLINMKDLIGRHNKNIKESQFRLVNPGTNQEAVTFVFDECSEIISTKEKQDPLFLPFLAAQPDQANEITSIGEGDGDVDQSSSKEKQKYRILPQKSPMQGFLGSLLESKNELMKYEYIEMVRRGMEEDHLLYLLSDPQERVTENQKEKEKFQKEKKNSLALIESPNNQTSGIFVETKRVIESQRKYMNDLIHQCKVTQTKAKNVVGKFNKHIGADPRLLKPSKRYLPLLNVLNSSQLYQEYLENKFRQQSTIAAERSTLAFERREEIEMNNNRTIIGIYQECGLSWVKEALGYVCVQFKSQNHLIELQEVSCKEKNEKNSYCTTARLAIVSIKTTKAQSLKMFSSPLPQVKALREDKNEPGQNATYCPEMGQLAVQFDNHLLNIAKSVDPTFLKYFKRHESGSLMKSQTNDVEQLSRKAPAPENLRPAKSITSYIANGKLADKIIKVENLQLLPSFVLNQYQTDLKEKLQLEDKRGGKKKIRKSLAQTSQNELKESVIGIVQQLEDPQPQGTLLPYSAHKDYVIMSLNYKFTFENPAVHEIILERVEAGQYLKQIRKKHRDNLREYNRQLMQFCKDYKHEVDLERTKLLLRTAPANLKQIEKKEEYEYKKSKQKQLVQGKVQQKYLVKDHLPFGTVILSIAAQMPKAPMKPVLKIKLNSETFKNQMDEYYKSFKIMYNRAYTDQRILSMNQQKAKKLAQKFNTGQEYL